MTSSEVGQFEVILVWRSFSTTCDKDVLRFHVLVPPKSVRKTDSRDLDSYQDNIVIPLPILNLVRAILLHCMNAD